MSVIEATAFGEVLREYCLVAGLTQEELAERANLSVRAVSELERGVCRAPHKETLGLLAQALDLAPEQRAVFEAIGRGHRLSEARRPVTLPSGTVTFLFTDIEGSTTRWEQHPAAMRAALQWCIQSREAGLGLRMVGTRGR